MADHPLDRAVFNALTGFQAAHAVADGPARRFKGEIGPLAGGADSGREAAEALARLAAGDDISLLEPAPPAPPAGVTVLSSAICLQMTARAMTAGDHGAIRIEPLAAADAEAMLDLATLTRPGPFRLHTHSLGRFLGVWENGVLIAMAGERMRLDGFTEISAVCTHPDHRGKGLGAALMRAVGARILSEGATPFLHSYADNASAVALYRSLGFETRRDVTHAVWRCD